MKKELSELWKITEFRHLLVARVISNFGNGIAPIALAFGVLSLPGADAGSLSLVTTAHMIPLVLFMLIGGLDELIWLVSRTSSEVCLLESALSPSSQVMHQFLCSASIVSYSVS